VDILRAAQARRIESEEVMQLLDRGLLTEAEAKERLFSEGEGL
jgi:hypothetical protein